MAEALDKQPKGAARAPPQGARAAPAHPGLLLVVSLQKILPPDQGLAERMPRALSLY